MRASRWPRAVRAVQCEPLGSIGVVRSHLPPGSCAGHNIKRRPDPMRAARAASAGRTGNVMRPGTPVPLDDPGMHPTALRNAAEPRT